MKLYIYITCVALVVIAFTSCIKKQTRNEKLLIQAQNFAEENPSRALQLLDSIDSPTLLDKDLYMKYIVTKTHIKFNNGLNVKDDTTKLNMEMAISYFEKQNNIKQLNLAYFYIGNIHSQRNEGEKAFGYYLKSLACQKRNNLPLQNDELFLQGKTYFNIGLYYYFNNLKDSANLNWEKSLQIFKKLEKNTNTAKNLFSLAMVSYLKDNIILSKQYASQSLTLASKTDNKSTIFNSINLLATLAREQEQYDQSLILFDEAINKGTSYIDTTKNYVGRVQTYIALKDIRSASEYIGELKQRLPNTKELYTLLTLSKTLADFYKEKQDNEKARYYAKLSDTVQEQINSKKITSKLYELDKNSTLNIYKKEKTLLKSKYIYINSVAILAFIILFIYFRIIIARKMWLLKFNIKQLRESN